MFLHSRLNIVLLWVDLYHAILLNTISDQEAAATLKSKVLPKQSRFYMTAFLLKDSCKQWCCIDLLYKGSCDQVC